MATTRERFEQPWQATWVVRVRAPSGRRRDALKAWTSARGMAPARPAHLHDQNDPSAVAHAARETRIASPGRSP
jgi:hypothetical protein